MEVLKEWGFYNNDRCNGKSVFSKKENKIEIEGESFWKEWSESLIFPFIGILLSFDSKFDVSVSEKSWRDWWSCLEISVLKNCDAILEIVARYELQLVGVLCTIEKSWRDLPGSGTLYKESLTHLLK